MKMTKPIFKRLVDQYREEFEVNPLRYTRQRNVLVPRQTLFYILNTKFHIHFQTLSEWTGWDRTVMYNSYRAVENAIHTKDSHYIDEINKWKLIFDSLDGFVKVKKLKSSQSVSAEATIIDFLSKFDTDESVDILYNVLNIIKLND